MADIDVVVSSCTIDYKGAIKFKLIANDEWYTFYYENDGKYTELGRGATSLLATEVNGRSFTGTFLGVFSENGDIAVSSVAVKEL